MKRFVLVTLVAMVLCASLGGCVQPKPASPSIFFGNCITPMGPDPCDSDMSICQVFENVITQQYATVGACRTACNQAFNQLSYQYMAQDCNYMFIRGSDLCDQECLRQYPKDK